MNRLSILLILSIFLTSCTNTGKSGQEASESTRPNVLFIVVDDLNTTLGSYDHPLVQTPNIDRLATTGVQFDHAYCNFAVCNPSRSSFLLGLRPETTTIIDNRKPIQSIMGDRISLPMLFKKNGYKTITMGKVFHGTHGGHGDPDAWDEMYSFGKTELGKQGEKRNMTGGVLKWCWWQATEGDDEDLPDGQYARKAAEILRADHEEPFFLAVGFHKPHDPFIAPKKYFDMYPIEACDPPTLPEGWEPPYDHTLPGQTDIFNKFTEQDKREFLRSYYACCSFLDAQVGKVMKALEESGQKDNSLVVFFGDHGYHLGEHNWWNKVTIFEKGTNAPFIVAGPGVDSSGVRTQAMIEFIDIYPTLADYANLDSVPDYLEGESFVGVLEDPTQTFRDDVHAVVRRGDMMGRMVKNERWRYIEWGRGEHGNELYDQVNDPIEYNNLADDPEYSDVVKEMQERL